MIEFVVGTPGSGKTYYALTRMIKTFSKDKTLVKKISNDFKIKDVHQAYTNVNELELDRFENVKKLDFDELLEKLTILEKHYKVDKYNDKELIVVAKELDVYGTMFLIDEAHNYFDINNKVLTWWLSYHRHFNQHIILITQNISLIYLKYKSFSELFYKAVPPTLKILNLNMIYKKYTSSRLSKTVYAGSMKVKIYSEVFEYYGSGANHKSKSVILPYIIVALSILICIFLYLKFGYTSSYEEIKPKPKVSNKTTHNTTATTSKKKESKELDKFVDKKLITVFCSAQTCYYKDISFTKKLINKKYDVFVLNKFKITNSTYTYTVLIPNVVFEMFDIENKNFILGVKNDDKKSADYFNITK